MKSRQNLRRVPLGGRCERLRRHPNSDLNREKAGLGIAATLTADARKLIYELRLA